MKRKAKTTIREAAPTTVNGTLRPPRRTNAPLRPREFLTGEEVERLRKACCERLGRYAPRDSTTTPMASRPGLRVSEVVALRWDMIDLSQGHMHVSRLKQGRPSTHILRGSDSLFESGWACRPHLTAAAGEEPLGRQDEG